ncbi:MAG: hypothetical protein JXN60_03555, partial [Lentisphaerae bacterium]|nr:hypothetical protein [Lentisphaerota bacterium]
KRFLKESPGEFFSRINRAYGGWQQSYFLTNIAIAVMTAITPKSIITFLICGHTANRLDFLLKGYTIEGYRDLA